MIINNNLFLKFFFILLPFVYSTLYTPFGFGDDDTGFILGLSWQFSTGSIPYSEIIYVRPPVSYIFHSLSLFFGNYSLIIDRSIFYFQVAIYSYLAILLLAKNFKFTDNQNFIFFLASLSFILSVHTFPPMAWHTVDGIFFSMLGVYIILTFNRPSIIFLGALCLVLGALSKQPFYLIPIVTLGYILIQHNYKKLWFALISIAVVSILFLYYLKINSALSDFITLTTGQTHIDDLLSVGIISYIKGLKYFTVVCLPPAVIIPILSRFNSKINFSKYFYILILWILILSFYIYVKNNAFTSPVYGFPHALFIASIIIVFYKILKSRSEKYYLALLLLILSWTSSISWGYNTPVLFSAPMLFILGISVQKDFKRKNINIFAFSLLVFAFIVFYVGYQNPYNLDHSSKRSKLTYRMDDIYQKLKYIYSDRKTYMEYKELKYFISKYGKNFTVLPDVTLIHYLSNTKNPIGVDWAMNAEINNQDTHIIKILEAKNIVVFLKKGEVKADGKFGSSVTVYIHKNWKKISTGKFFDVYTHTNM